MPAFLAQGDEWQDDAEPMLAELRRAVERTPPPGRDTLRASVAHQIEGCALPAAGRWGDAGRAALDVATALDPDRDATRAYCAL